MIEQTYVDKSTWGDGPWKDEPDRVSWVDEESGLPCIVLRGPSGALCGYVGIRPGHPLHGVHYSDMDDESFDVHGGLTFTSGCDGDPQRGVCHIPDDGKPDDVWWLGFDCAHGYDIVPRMEADLRAAGIDYPRMPATGRWPASTYKDVEYVMIQCRDLASQLSD